MTQSYSNDEATLTHLSRLSSKPGVRSTLILDRETRSIVRSSGFVSSSTSSQGTTTTTDSSTTTAPTTTLASPSPAGPLRESPSFTSEINSKTAGTASTTKIDRVPGSAEEIAELVWGFVRAATALAEGVTREPDLEEGPNGVKLLRLRTRRFECVVVPDSKFLLVVVHNTPEA